MESKDYIEILQSIMKRHLASSNSNDSNYLYRVFFYDAPPLDLSIHYPIKNPGEIHKQHVKFSEKPENKCRAEFLEKLRTQRKVALRMGQIKHYKQWKIKDKVVADILTKEKSIDDLRTKDFYFDAQQKGVDIKLGLDIATLAYEKLVDQIILIAGDSDFVPAAKLARTKGVDFVLDSLRSDIDPALNEHVDGLNSFDLVSILSSVLKVDPDTKPNWWKDEETHSRNKAKKRGNGRRASRG